MVCVFGIAPFIPRLSTLLKGEDDPQDVFACLASESARPAVGYSCMFASFSSHQKVPEGILGCTLRFGALPPQGNDVCVRTRSRRKCVCDALLLSLTTSSSCPVISCGQSVHETSPYIVRA